MSKQEVKNIIKEMSKYDTNKLNELSNISGVSIMTINFWWNAIKN